MSRGTAHPMAPGDIPLGQPTGATPGSCTKPPFVLGHLMAVIAEPYLPTHRPVPVAKAVPFRLLGGRRALGRAAAGQGRPEVRPKLRGVRALPRHRIATLPLTVRAGLDGLQRAGRGAAPPTRWAHTPAPRCPDPETKVQTGI